MRIGYFSLPVVGLTALSTGAVLALQIYLGGNRYGAEAIVPQIVVLAITRELGPVIAGLMVAGRVAAARAAHRRRDRHHEGDGADRRPDHAFDQPGQISGGAAPCRRRAVHADPDGG